MDMNLVAAEYRARGWRVMPVNGKTPVYSGWAHPDWVCPPFKAGENIGIITGRSSGLVVLDVDPKNGGWDSYMSLLGLYGPMNAPEVITGSGGRHFYFKHPKVFQVPNSTSKIGPGIDIRGDGGFVVAVPSIHPNGTPYRWAMAGEPPPVPSWLLQRVGTSGQESTKRNTRDEWTKLLAEGVKTGSRNETLAKLAGRLLIGLSAPIVLELLKCFNEARLRPPVSDSEVEAVVRSIARKEREKDVAPSMSLTRSPPR